MVNNQVLEATNTWQFKMVCIINNNLHFCAECGTKKRRINTHTQRSRKNICNNKGKQEKYQMPNEFIQLGKPK